MSLNEDARRSAQIGCGVPQYKAVIARLNKELATEFSRGMCIAAAQVKRSHDEPGIAYELLKSAGITTRKACRDLGLEEYDLTPLYSVLKSERKR